MTDRSIRILLVEDNPADARLLREHLSEVSSLCFQLTHVERLEEAGERMMETGADVVLLDLSLPDAHGMETVTKMLEAAPDVPIIVLTGFDDETVALRAVQAGAQDYLVKGQVDGNGLARAIRYARERKRLERERARLLESEREARSLAEQAVRGRDEVLRVVAHDLGNSLGAVLVTTAVLKRTLPEVDPDGRLRHLVANVRTLAEQMQRLRQDLLDVAMLEAGKLSIRTEPLDPTELLATCLERYEPMAAEKALRLESRLNGDLPMILGDEDRLVQVVDNLVTNAMKFTPSGGRVVLGAEHVDGAVRIFITDSGPGIPSENLPHLFDRFWTTRQGNPTGAGLGLAIAKGIVDAHGGMIQVESTEGGGSSFSFTIPQVTERSRAVDAPTRL